MDHPPERGTIGEPKGLKLIAWVKNLENKINSQRVDSYNRLSKLEEDKFQGNIRLNFSSGRIVSINIYDTVDLK